jgi:hypothetical protein
MKRNLARPPQTAEIRIDGSIFKAAEATLLSQDDAIFGQQAEFLYQDRGGFVVLRKLGFNFFEGQRLSEGDALAVWLRHQTGRIHVPLEAAFPGAKVEEA